MCILGFFATNMYRLMVAMDSMQETRHMSVDNSATALCQLSGMETMIVAIPRQWYVST